MTPEEERALYAEFLAQRDSSEEAEERFDQRGQLDQDWHDFLQARMKAVVSDSQLAQIAEWHKGMVQQFVASINAKAMENDPPEEPKK